MIADSHYPGWVAYVNDVEKPIHRADYLLRAVAIDAGPAIVRMEYRPNSFRIGGLLSVFGWVLVLCVVVIVKKGAKASKSHQIDPSSR